MKKLSYVFWMGLMGFFIGKWLTKLEAGDSRPIVIVNLVLASVALGFWALMAWLEDRYEQKIKEVSE